MAHFSLISKRIRDASPYAISYESLIIFFLFFVKDEYNENNVISIQNIHTF